MSDTASDLRLVVTDFLLQDSWAGREVLLRRHERSFLDEAADGTLAVLHAAYSHDTEFLWRIEDMRSLLDLARNNNYTGTNVSLTKLFEPVFGDDGPDGEFYLPARPPGVDSDDDIFAYAHAFVAMALIKSRSWRVRRHIIAAYPDFLRDGGFERALAQFRNATAEGIKPLFDRLLAVLATARRSGLDAAVPRVPPSPLRLTGAPRDRVYLTDGEQVSLAALQYWNTPTWAQRIEILQLHADILLTPEVDGMFRDLEERYAHLEAKKHAIAIARHYLDKARRLGIQVAFDGPLPPTYIHVPDNPVPNMEEAPRTSAERLHECGLIRQVVYTTDPDLAPLRWAYFNRLLAATLLNFPTVALREVYAEESIIRCFDALEVLGGNSRAADRCEVKFVLGKAYLNRVRGDNATNIENAIKYLGDVAAEYATVDDELSAAEVRLNLAFAYARRTIGVEAISRQRARELSLSTLAIFRDAKNVKNWVLAKIVLGQAFLDSVRHGVPGAREDAVAHLRDAVAALDPVAEPDLWFLANQTWVHTLTAGRETLSPSDYDQAVGLLRNCQRAVDRQDRSFDWAMMQRSFGVVHAKHPDRSSRYRELASTHLRAALEILGQRYPFHRRRTLSDLGRVLFDEGKWLECADVLREVVDLGQFLEGMSDSDPSRLAEIGEMTNVQDRYVYCLIQLGQREQALEQFEDGKARVLRSRISSTGQRRDLALDELVPTGGAIVLPVVTSRGAAVFAIFRQQDQTVTEVIELRDLTSDHIQQLLDGSPDDPGWFAAYGDWLRHRQLPQGKSAEAAKAWTWQLVHTCRAIWKALIAPIIRHLRDRNVEAGTEIAVLPSKWLGLLPLSAAAYVDNAGRPRYLLDDHVVTIAPSLDVRTTALDRRSNRTRRSPDLLALVNPTGDLPGALEEWGAIQKIVPSAVAFVGQRATPARLAESLRGRTHLHLACHAGFGWLDAMESGLVLANGHNLSVQEIAELPLAGVELVTLSACESGIVEFAKVPDEFIGLPGAFIAGGAANVVCSLWSVADEATALLMAEFYRQHLQHGLSPASALRAAQQHMRNNPAFAHPYFWAGFVCVGA